MKLFFEIFITFFKIGLFTIGGGYAMIPIIQQEVAERKRWMSDEEFLDAISLTNSLPGPLAVNAATFVGYRVKGVAGAVTSAIGVAAPSVIIILLIAMVFRTIMEYAAVQHFFEGVRPAVAALIFYSVIKLGKSVKVTKQLNWLMAVFAFFAIALFGLHPIAVIVCAALYGIFVRESLLKEVEKHRGGKEAGK